MRIAAFELVNYKSFADSGEVRLEPGFNVIVGQNNVGKTAVAEALSLRFGNTPHLSTGAVPNPSDEPEDPVSRTHVSFEISKEELKDFLVGDLPTFYVPAGEVHDVNIEVVRFVNSLSERNRIRATFQQGGFVSAHLESYGDRPTVRSHLGFTWEASEGLPKYEGQYSAGADSDNFALRLVRALAGRIYGFRAVRFGIGDNPIGTDTNLQPDAANLAQVLNYLQVNDPDRWDEYVAGVRTVLPQIQHITVPPVEGTGAVRVKLWNVPRAARRPDLAVPVSESGTGIGQVLAMLYVVFTSEYPRTIVIDEPQSFLHPGAVRKLFEILKGYPQHQYIITTHSPNAVTAAAPQALFLVRKEGEESVVEQLDVSETRDQARFLREVGASLTDVFGADNVLWVEGPTEEECFPLILSAPAERRLLGTKIVGVLSTGDLEGKRSRDVYRIYRRLSEGGGLLPPAVGFVFDREGRTEKQREDLRRESGGLVAFLPRRMYESYLLNPKALAHVATGIEGFRDNGGVSPREVESWIGQHRWDPEYFEAPVEESSRNEELWLKEVDAAKLLKDLFAELSEARVAYDKVPHGVALTRWLSENAPDDLREIADLIEERLDRSTKEAAEGDSA